jgi:DNA-binding MurR/RpiR family transcriptional regulator
VNRITEATRHQTLLVVSSRSHSPELLERVTDAKKLGVRIMSVHRGDDDLADLSHEMVAVGPSRPEHDFDLAQHIVTDVAPTSDDGAHARWARVPLLHRSPSVLLGGYLTGR